MVHHMSRDGTTCTRPSFSRWMAMISPRLVSLVPRYPGVVILLIRPRERTSGDEALQLARLPDLEPG